MYIVFFFVFFKQKTAYEMRISDWSSDVCSSDLKDRCRDMPCPFDFADHVEGQPPLAGQNLGRARLPDQGRQIGAGAPFRLHGRFNRFHRVQLVDRPPLPLIFIDQGCQHIETILVRSEEHTSELQSLMRISYAVFCLKKKNTTNRNIYYTINPKTRQRAKIDKQAISQE